jgi:glycosyltransferase involved in cell wall biosynthesis
VTARGGLRVTWVLPFQRFTGGIRVVYEHSRQLLARGHDVTLVVPREDPTLPGPRSLLQRARASAVDLLLERSAAMLRYYGLAERVVRPARLDPATLPAGDVVIATSWHTADVVAAAPTSAGRGAYFVQHYEAFTPDVESAVDATWRLPLERIVIASWLARLARERFGVPAWGPVVNGVDLDQFHAEGRPEGGPPRVGMLYERIPWKGTDDGFEAVRLARADVPELRFSLYGRHRMQHPLRPGDSYVRSPSPARLSAFYRECALFLSPSWTEGCQLPPMEAMASGCAVVATNVGGIPDYAVSGVTALTAEPHDPPALARHLVALARDPSLRARIAQAGREHIERYSWPRATGELERILVDIVSGKSPA